MASRNIVLLATFMLIFSSEAAADCEKLPADFNPQGCCKSPVTDTDVEVKKLVDQFKDQKLDEYMLECKVIEAMFKEFKWAKDNAIDKDGMLKYMDDKIKEESWKTVSKTVIEKCAKETTANKDKIEKELAAAPYNISKDKCNPIFMSMLVCIQLEGFVSCPKDFWTEGKGCVETKDWIIKCGDKIEALVMMGKSGNK